MKALILAAAIATCSSGSAYAQSAQSRPGPAQPQGQPAAQQQGPATAPSSAPAPSPVLAPSQGPGPGMTACRPILALPGVRMTIEANVNVATRLQFAASVAKDEVSTPDLWDGSYTGSSVWIRPKTTVREADRTGLTVFLDNGRSYDFLVMAASAVPQSCILIVDYPTGTAAAPAASAPPAPTRSAADIEAARQAANARARAARVARVRASAQQQAELTAKFDQMRRQVEQQANDRIKQFEYAIDTQYQWDGETPDDQLLVNAVYDDGRFTYVRVTTTAFGLPALSGRLDGKDTLLEFNFDDLTGVFTVQGLYDKLRLKLGTHIIKIVRKG